MQELEKEPRNCALILECLRQYCENSDIAALLSTGDVRVINTMVEAHIREAGGRRAYRDALETQELDESELDAARKKVFEYVRTKHPELLRFHRLGAAMTIALLRHPDPSERTTEDAMRILNKHFSANIGESVMASMTYRAGGRQAAATLLAEELQLTQEELDAGARRVDELWPQIAAEKAARRKMKTKWRDTPGAPELAAAVYEASQSPSDVAHAMQLFFGIAITRSSFKTLFQRSARNPSVDVHAVLAELYAYPARLDPQNAAVHINAAKKRVRLLDRLIWEISAPRLYTKELRAEAPLRMSARLQNPDFERILNALCTPDMHSNVPYVELIQASFRDPQTKEGLHELTISFDYLRGSLRTPENLKRFETLRDLVNAEIEDMKNKLPTSLSAMAAARKPPIRRITLRVKDAGTPTVPVNYRIANSVTLPKRWQYPSFPDEARAVTPDESTLEPLLTSLTQRLEAAQISLDEFDRSAPLIRERAASVARDIREGTKVTQQLLELRAAGGWDEVAAMRMKLLNERIESIERRLSALLQIASRLHETDLLRGEQ
jgi:hypothetical protein